MKKTLQSTKNTNNNKNKTNTHLDLSMFSLVPRPCPLAKSAAHQLHVDSKDVSSGAAHRCQGNQDPQEAANAGHPNHK